MKASAFFPASVAAATSARSRSPAEMWMSPNCSSNKMSHALLKRLSF